MDVEGSRGAINSTAIDWAVLRQVEHERLQSTDCLFALHQGDVAL